ncbi:MAG: methyltransferase domain-containing protein [Acidobacteriota bacterium]|nr:methyltransferase domain-containing protein [Acidobacteriota bacterium]
MTGAAEPIDPWFLEHLVCPADRGALQLATGAFECPTGHRFPIVDGVPVMLLESVPATMAGTESSLRRARGEGVDARAPELHLESLGVSDAEKEGIVALARRGGPVDPVVAYLVAATNGLMYRHLIGALDRYPIPDIPLPSGDGRSLLDVGCSWGRWSLAAHAKGYAVVGLDPSLGAVMAARRVARQVGASNRYVVGDARHLPFAPRLFDVTYSYSVIQHLSRADAGKAVRELGRVLKPGGTAKVQMPTRFGVRCLYHQARRRFREGSGFEVRYWTLPELRQLFGSHVGVTRFDADCYFAIGLQLADVSLMPPGLRLVIQASQRMKSASRRWPILVHVADSVFVESVARHGTRP